MAISMIEICNLALAELGSDDAIASLEEGSAESSACNKWYDRCRRALLESHEWGFAVKVASLTQLATAPTGWDYGYQLPSDYVRAISIDSGVYTGSSDVASHDKEIEFEVLGGGQLGCDEDEAALRYIYNVTDCNRFSDGFVMALVALLASRICMAITGDSDLKESLSQSYLSDWQNATAMSNRASRKKVRYGRTFVDAR